MSSDDYELDIYEIKKIDANSQDDCVICLNTYSDEFVVLKCCSNRIHEQCLIQWVLYQNNNDILCPLCRDCLEDSVNILKFLIFVNDNMYRIEISRNKILRIIKRLYKDEPIIELFFLNCDIENDIENDIDNHSRDNVNNVVRRNRYTTYFTNIISELSQRIALFWFIFLVLFITIIFINGK